MDKIKKIILDFFFCFPENYSRRTCKSTDKKDSGLRPLLPFNTAEILSADVCFTTLHANSIDSDHTVPFCVHTVC